MLKQIVFLAAATTLLTVGPGAQSRGAAAVTGLADAAAAQAPTPVVPQTTPIGPQPAQASAQRPAEPQGQAINIGIELTIAETGGGAGPTKKTVSMIVADRQAGFVRSKGTVRLSPNRSRDVTINVDARPTITREGTVRLDLGIEYQPKIGSESGNAAESATPAGPAAPAMQTLLTEPASSNLNQRVVVILESAKALLISQAADPGSDRQIAITVKATILK